MSSKKTKKKFLPHLKKSFLPSPFVFMKKITIQKKIIEYKNLSPSLIYEKTPQMQKKNIIIPPFLIMKKQHKYKKKYHNSPIFEPVIFDYLTIPTNSPLYLSQKNKIFKKKQILCCCWFCFFIFVCVVI